MFIVISQVSAFDCGGQLGLIPNLYDCSSFYLCSPDGQATLEYCGDQQMFDDIFFICNYDYAVDCGDRPQPSTTKPGLNKTSNDGYHLRFPDKVVGFYVLLADDTEDGYHTDDEWEPKLYPYQQGRVIKSNIVGSLSQLMIISITI